MSVSTSVYALDSIVKAPEIGDQGCIGLPPINSEGDDHNFLRIYAGLSLLGLATRELDAFYAFVEKYKYEHLYFSIDGDDGEDSDRLNEILEDLEGRGERMPVFELESPENYTQARYRISCGANTLETGYTDFFRKTDTFSVDKENLSRLIDEVFEVPDWDTVFHRVWGIADPYDGDLGEIRKFVLKHSGPFKIEYLTDDLARREILLEEEVVDPDLAEQQANVSETLKNIKPADSRSSWVKIRDGIILLFFIWLGIRIIYHTYMYFSQ